MDLSPDQLKCIQANYERAKRIRHTKLDQQQTLESQNDNGLAPAKLDHQACIVCESLEIDDYLREKFKIAICENCRSLYPDRFSLITKTEARERFLLTNEELQDSALFPCISKPNPHKSTWSSMQLYLREHVQNFAIAKWGSMAAIQAEMDSRDDTLLKRKEAKFKSRLTELRKKTRTESSNLKSASNRHKHNFITKTTLGKLIQECKECGFKFESEEI